MMKKILAICVALLAAFSAQAADDAFRASFIRLIQGVCPESVSERTDIADGFLAPGKLKDVAVVTSCESGEEQQLLVFREQPDGSYKPAFRSEAWSWNGRSEASIEFRKNTIVFPEHCAYNCNPESWASSYKFKLRDKELILIGEDHAKSVLSGKNLQNETSSGTSINYLTDTLIDWWKSTSFGYSEKKSALNLKAPIALSQFNMETCTISGSCAKGLPH